MPAAGTPSLGTLQADVLLIGGGTAGVDFPRLFHAWGQQIIAGIGRELAGR